MVEVGPRDGLQNEPGLSKLDPEKLIDTRLKFIVQLAQSGLEDVEAGAFVRADRIPAMVGTEKILARLQTEYPDLWKTKRFWTLVPNHKGLEAALKADAKHVSVFTATSDAFNLKNIKMTVEESLKELRPVVKEANNSGLKVRGYLSTVWGCPYAGPIPISQTQKIVAELQEIGVQEISLGDTIGVATPKQVKEVLDSLETRVPLAVHFHDTRGTAIANSLEAIQLGIRTVDSSAGGLGGCPYAKGASGNLATEDLLYMIDGMSFQSGVNLDGVCKASQFVENELRLNLKSRYFSAWKGRAS